MSKDLRRLNLPLSIQNALFTSRRATSIKKIELFLILWRNSRVSERGQKRQGKRIRCVALNFSRFCDDWPVTENPSIVDRCKPSIKDIDQWLSCVYCKCIEEQSNWIPWQHHCPHEQEQMLVSASIFFWEIWYSLYYIGCGDGYHNSIKGLLILQRDRKNNEYSLRVLIIIQFWFLFFKFWNIHSFRQTPKHTLQMTWHGDMLSNLSTYKINSLFTINFLCLYNLCHMFASWHVN